MTRKDFKIVAQILAEISDPWARSQAINQACFRLGQAFPRFDASRFQKFVRDMEKSEGPA